MTVAFELCLRTRFVLECRGERCFSKKKPAGQTKSLGRARRVVPNKRHILDPDPHPSFQRFVNRRQCHGCFTIGFLRIRRAAQLTSNGGFVTGQHPHSEPVTRKCEQGVVDGPVRAVGESGLRVWMNARLGETRQWDHMLYVIPPDAPHEPRNVY